MAEPIHFTFQGPSEVFRREEPTARTTPDGEEVTITHAVFWCPAEHHFGLGREEVGESVFRVLNDSRGLVRAGIWFKRVERRFADVIVRYVEECSNGPGYAGYARWNTSPLVPSTVEVLAPLIGRSKVLIHEFVHGFAGAQDMYEKQYPGHAAYSGIMGNSGPSLQWPTDNDIRSIKAWLAGRAPKVHRH